MSSASHLAKDGWNVTVVEKHNMPGGRARKLEANGFTFDMGPSWYWMPDVLKDISKILEKRSDYYKLIRLDPSYKIFWKDDEMQIPADYEGIEKVI